MPARPFLKQIAPYLLIGAALLLLFVVLGHMRPVRVGDGSEYYGLFYAFEAGHRPWMAPQAYAAYERLFASGSVLGLVPREFLANAFTALRVGETSDFNHFWFYSLLAFGCNKLAALFGIALSVHRSFVALHLVCMSATCAIAYRLFSWKGVLAVALMLLASPMLWFMDKAHTEFMTVCLATSAVMLVMGQRYLAAALCLALASTQNPSFALIACIPLFYRAVLERQRAYAWTEVAMAVLVVLAVLMHPVYYFCRYGVATPQLLAGGAALGANLSTFYVWIIDPDVGLLPNWPLGVAVLVLALLSLWPRSGAAPVRAIDRRWLAFALGYLLINFYAHSSTTNLNSGATPGLARYALWYLPLAFPLFLRVFTLFPTRSRAWYAALPLLLLLCAASLWTNDPRRFEQYTRPSWPSLFVQTHLPFLYNPPAEIFAERYAGIGEEVHQRAVRAVIGPDCRKMLVWPGPQRHGAIGAPDCMFDPARLGAYVDSAAFLQRSGALGAGAPFYASLAGEDVAGLQIVLRSGPHSAASDATSVSIMGQGWSVREAWGTWSDSAAPQLALPCNPAQYYDGKPFTLLLKLRPFQRQTLTVRAGRTVLWEGAVTEVDQVVAVPLTPANCKRGVVRLTLELPHAVSPLRLGQSGDGRLLGVGLSSFEVKVP